MVQPRTRHLLAALVVALAVHCDAAFHCSRGGRSVAHGRLDRFSGIGRRRGVWRESASDAGLAADPGSEASSVAELRGGAEAPPPLPTMTEITKFAVPALALWLTGPLLSLIDSSAVGLSGGKTSAIGLAALGPATTLIDGSAYLFAFINVATTNLYATALARNDPREAELVTRTSIKVALWCGLGVSAVLLSTTPWLLKTYVGGAAALILPAAVSYSR